MRVISQQLCKATTKDPKAMQSSLLQSIIYITGVAIGNTILPHFRNLVKKQAGVNTLFSAS